MKKIRWWQRVIQRIALRPGVSSILSRTLHRLDRFSLSISKGRVTLTNLLAGLQVVELTTTGRKSGKARTIPLSAMMVEDKVVLLASAFGKTRHPAWYLNLKANPGATITYQGETNRYISREAAGSERAQYWAAAAWTYPGFVDYQKRAGERKIPVMVLEKG